MKTEASLNVLIVEDDTAARDNLRDVLDVDGYCVATDSTAAEAFGRTDLAETDVVILGRRLLDGYVEDVLPRLRDIAPDASIIVATEYADLESTIAALRLGVADYILKPIDVDALKSSLSRISERRQIDDALRDRETRFQAILNTAVDAIITIDEWGLIESLNVAAEQLFGYSADEAICGNVSMLMPAPYSKEHDDYLNRYRETGLRKIIGIGREVTGRHKDGTVFPIELTVSEVELGTRRLFTGIVRDISFRKQAEEQLQLLGTALRVLNEGVVITEASLDFPGPRILFVNEAMTRITGYTRDELLSKTPRIFQGAKTDRSVMQRLKQELSAGRPFEGETVNYRKDGRAFFVQL